jgi:hypothetical protein
MSVRTEESGETGIRPFRVEVGADVLEDLRVVCDRHPSRVPRAALVDLANSRAARFPQSRRIN